MLVFGGTMNNPVFPAGWRPVAFYPWIRTWDLAPSWYAPLARVLRVVVYDARFITARVLFAMARKVAGER